jgi:hypothetical protein
MMSRNIIVLLSIITLIVIFFIRKLSYGSSQNIEGFNDNFYYNRMIIASKKLDITPSNQRMALRVNSSKNIIPDNENDVITLPYEVVTFYNNILKNNCNMNINFPSTISRDYYNKNIGPQLYWKIIDSDNKNKEDALLSLGIIELTIFQGNKIVYNDNNVILSDEIKDLLESDKLELTKEEFKILLLKYVNNLFDENTIVQNMKKVSPGNNNNITTETLKKMIISSINMIKEDSKNVCKRIVNYQDVIKRNQYSFAQRLTNMNNYVKSISTLKQTNDNNILDFGLDTNILLNNLLEKFTPIIDKQLSEIIFPMTERNYNKLKIIPLYIITSSLSDNDKKYYSGLYAVIHYGVKTNNFENLNNFLNKLPITINDKVKEAIRSNKNEFTYDETLNLFYNHYKLIFSKIINK